MTTHARPALSVVVPVYSGASTIVENVGVIRTALEGMVDGDLELIIVSDGSIDDTAGVLLASRPVTGARVIHYDRNLGKGYAIKVGALAARGDWIAFVDADLDIDPGEIPAYLEVARREQLDFAIGSKRHPDSVVHYPRSRRVASWCYQQLNRVLFRLNVSDTQVGLKLFRREIADNVFPLLLVKQFAFDLEMLVVARELGYRRMRELPVRLDYRFTGSGVRSAAVGRALLDTAAIFYRVRILRTYQRKRQLLRPERVNGGVDHRPLVTLVGGDADTAHRLDYRAIEVSTTADRAAAARSARGDLLGLMAPGTSPAGNWLSAAAAYFVRHQVAAVVSPLMAPKHGSVRSRAAAAILESRLGVGSRRVRYSPGNVRLVADYPAESIVVRRRDYVDALEAGIPDERLVAWLVHRGREVVYAPETMVVDDPAPILLPHLRAVADHARSRGAALRLSRGATINLQRLLELSPFLLGMAGVPLALWAGEGRNLGIAFLLVYGVAALLSAATAGFHFRSWRIAALVPPVLFASHLTYAGAFVAGLFRGR